MRTTDSEPGGRSRPEPVTAPDPGSPEGSPSPFENPAGALGGAESRIYGHRFSPDQERARCEVWRHLVRDFLQRYVSPEDAVLDVGAGDGLFLTHLRARRRIAVDVSSHTAALGAEGIQVIRVPGTDFARHLSDPVDVVFMSNFLEHLPSKVQVLEALDECLRALRPGGTLLVLQPNIRYVGAAYWDYIDHHVAITERSLAEALEICGFELERVVPRFLPYTAKSRLSRLAWATRLYLRLPILWRIFGKQTFVVARKPVPRTREKSHES